MRDLTSVNFEALVDVEEIPVRVGEAALRGDGVLLGLAEVREEELNDSTLEGSGALLAAGLGIYHG